MSLGVFGFPLPFDKGMNNVFGLKSGCTSCTTNMHQGWTKFTTHLWYSTEKGIAALIYSPNELMTKIQDQEVIINEETNYPFEDQINFTFTLKKELSFPLSLRIPSWCSEAVISVNEKQLKTEAGGKIAVIERTLKNADKLTLKLPMQIATSNWGRNSRAAELYRMVHLEFVGYG